MLLFELHACVCVCVCVCVFVCARTHARSCVCSWRGQEEGYGCTFITYMYKLLILFILPDPLLYNPDHVSLNKTVCAMTANKPRIWKSRFFVVDDEHQLLYCQIPKSGLTTWLSLLATATSKGHKQHFNDSAIVHQPSYRKSVGLRTFRSYNGTSHQLIYVYSSTSWSSPKAFTIITSSQDLCISISALV